MKLKIYKKMESYPKDTPMFGACKTCRAVLPYPPIQIPRKPIPNTKGEGSMVLKYAIVWDRYCINCAKSKLRAVTAQEMVPDKAWNLASGAVIDNPYTKESK